MLFAQYDSLYRKFLYISIGFIEYFTFVYFLLKIF